MTDVLSIMNTLSLTLQKEGALLVDIKCSVDITVEQLRKLANAESPSDFQDIFAPNVSYYSKYNEYLEILSDLASTHKSL